MIHDAVKRLNPSKIKALAVKAPILSSVEKNPVRLWLRRVSRLLIRLKYRCRDCKLSLKPPLRRMQKALLSAARSTCYPVV